MNLLKNTFKLSVALVIATVTLTSCRNKTLEPLSKMAPVNLEYIDVTAKFCTDSRSIARQKVKYLFVLDHSRSNQPGIPDPATPNDINNSDPDGARRYGPMVQFINGLVPDPNNLTYFSLINFDTTAYAPQGIPGFIQDPDTFLDRYVRPDWIGSGTLAQPAPVDRGFTNYQGALQLVLTTIKSDAQLEALIPSDPPVTIQYHIVFVTDGAPTVPDGTGVITQSFLGDISPVITNLNNIKNDPIYKNIISGVALNTAYYFQAIADPAAQTLLQQMADAGGGQYLEFAAGQGVLYQSFAPPARNIKMNLADLWIENQNVVGWEDGRILADYDADGLPDAIESKFGSNITDADSDGNGVGDLVEYRTKGVPCKDAACAVAGRDPYAICDGFSPVIVGGKTQFKRSSNDGLNDCEKFILGAERANFDSNGDFIPDRLAFVNNIPFIAGTSGSFLDPYGDSMNQYTKLKLGYPVGISQRNIDGFIPRQLSLLREPDEAEDVDCYRYTAKKVAVLRGGDVIRVYLVQNQSIIGNKPVLKTVSKSWRAGELAVTFERGEFN
jgi:hypothetical protein